MRLYNGWLIQFSSFSILSFWVSSWDLKLRTVALVDSNTWLKSAIDKRAVELSGSIMSSLGSISSYVKPSSNKSRIFLKVSMSDVVKRLWELVS